MTVPIWGDVSGEDLAGVPPEMLPPKKRLVRYHPYEAASTIQEMASHGHGGFESPPVRLTAEGDASGRGDGRWERDDGLRAELLRHRILRPALVLTKRLTPSDRSRHKARLLLPDSLIRTSPLLSMLTAGERRLVFSRERGGLPVPVLDRVGRLYRMVLKRDRVTRRTYRLMGQWSLFVSRHDMRDGDTVEVLAFRPPSWQARLDRCGEGGLGMALLHYRNAATVNGRAWSNREHDAANGLLLLDANALPDGGRDGGGL